MVLLNIQDILPNHWHAPPHHTGNSAKSLAHSQQTDNSAKSLAPGMLLHMQAIGNSSSKSLAHCPQQTDNSAKLLEQAILPNHWYTPPYTGNSAKSLAQEILPNHWQRHNSAISLAPACSSTYRQFCQITTGTLSSTDRQFCQIIGTLATDRQFLSDSNSSCAEG